MFDYKILDDLFDQGWYLVGDLLLQCLLEEIWTDTRVLMLKPYPSVVTATDTRMPTEIIFLNDEGWSNRVLFTVNKAFFNGVSFFASDGYSITKKRLVLNDRIKSHRQMLDIEIKSKFYQIYSFFVDNISSDIEAAMKCMRNNWLKEDMGWLGYMCYRLFKQ